MAIQKNYLKSKPVCKVKFIFPEQLAQGAKTVHLVGTFNDWDIEAQKLRKQKTGEYAATLSLPVGEKHEFRYLLDGEHWENDDSADQYVPSRVSFEENSVVVI
ncbi:MAG TPA: isoamylase early set domain-containing protein [Marinagarivorans sp.]